MGKTAALNIRIEPELLAQIDAARGDVPRSVWVTHALRDRVQDRISTGRADAMLGPIAGTHDPQIGPTRSPNGRSGAIAKPKTQVDPVVKGGKP